MFGFAQFPDFVSVFYNFLILFRFFTLVFILFQSIAIGYKSSNPDSIVSVHAFDARPNIRVRDSETGPFRRFGFVDAVRELDPVGALGLLDQDYKVWVLSFLCVDQLVLWLFYLFAIVSLFIPFFFIDCVSNSGRSLPGQVG